MYKVLLVEDEEIIRRGIRNSIMWEDFGCHVVGEAENGEDGIEKIKELRPDIVITDINMPVMDGLAMIAETKIVYDYAAIILTGYSDFEYAREAIRNGVSGYVLKPLQMEEMKEVLERAVLELEKMRFFRQKQEKKGEAAPVSLLEEPPQTLDPVVRQILDYIEQNYKNKITMADLEEAVHYSERYMSQKFQHGLGTTVIEYLNRFRIQRALEIIQKGQIPLSSVGWECGIGEYKYFNYVFKKYMGVSAKEYQSRFR